MYPVNTLLPSSFLLSRCPSGLVPTRSHFLLTAPGKLEASNSSLESMS